MVVVIALLVVFGGGPNVSNVAMSSEIDPDTFEPLNKTSIFSTSTPEIFVTFDIDGYEIGTAVVGEWYYLTDEQFIDDASLFTTFDSQVAYFSLSRPFAGWPVGEYKIDIVIDEEIVETVEFRVE